MKEDAFDRWAKVLGLVLLVTFIVLHILEVRTYHLILCLLYAIIPIVRGVRSLRLRGRDFADALDILKIIGGVLLIVLSFIYILVR